MTEGQSAASAKPAPSLKEEIEKIIEIHSHCISEANDGYLSGLWATQFPDFPGKQGCSIIQELQKVLEAPPATERTALIKKITREKIDVLSMFAYQGPPSRHWIDTAGRYYEGWNAAIDKILAELDAQERTRV